MFDGDLSILGPHATAAIAWSIIGHVLGRVPVYKVPDMTLAVTIPDFSCLKSGIPIKN